jgi:hypothetical protein
MTALSDQPNFDRFFTRIGTKLALADFHAEFAQLLNCKRTSEELTDARLSRGRWKRIIDEVTPVERFLKFGNVTAGYVKFQLNNQVPDCWFWEKESGTPLGIEVTVAQARERYHLAKELVRKGIGRGFLGLSDSSTEQTFKKATARPRVMYSTEQALSAVKKGITLSLEKKKHPKYVGMDLLIQAPLRSLPDERWNLVKEELIAAASDMPFRQINVIGNTDQKIFGFRIK